MQFYNTTDTYLSLVHEVWSLCDADIISYPLADVTRRINGGLENLVGKILGADGMWQWDDDSNYTDLPRGTFTLVEGQERYTFNATYLEIEHIDVMTTTSGNWRRLKPIDRQELGDLTTEEYFGVTSGNPTTGFPTHYDKQGRSFRLFPAPTSTAVTLSAGGRVTFKRTADLFTTSDTTQSPGIPSPYHITLAYMAAIPFCTTYKRDRVPLYQKKVDEDIMDLIAFHARRDKDTRKIMTMRSTNYF